MKPTVLEFEPHLNVPDLDDLQQPIAEKLVQKLDPRCVGLKTITLNAIYGDDSGQLVRSRIARINVKGAGLGKMPSLSATKILQVVHWVADNYANQIRRKVTFACFCYSLGHKQQLQINFTIDSSDTEGAADQTVAPEFTDDGEPLDLSPISRGPGVVMARPANHEPRVFVNTDPLSTIASIMLAQQDTDAGLHAEMRASFSTVRSGFDTAFRSALDIVTDRCREISEDNISLREQLNEANRLLRSRSEGQAAFEDNCVRMYNSGLEMIGQAQQREFEWRQQTLVGEVQRITQRKVAPSGIGSAVREFSPIILAVAAAWLDKQGSPLAAAARTIGKQLDQENQDAEERAKAEDDEVQPVVNTWSSKGKVIAAVERFHKALGGLESELMTALPPNAKVAMESALRATNESQACMALVQLRVSLEADQEAKAAAMALLDAKQLEAFEEVRAAAEAHLGVSPPKRPEAQPEHQQTAPKVRRQRPTPPPPAA